MAFVTPYVGEVQLLKYMVNYAPADNVVLHLYTNNWTPTSSDTLANYTESVAAGYHSMTLPGSQWTVSTVAGTSSATFATQTFSYSTSETLYGYYITNNATSTLLWVELFTGAPFTIPSTGGTLQVNPDLTLI